MADLPQSETLRTMIRRFVSQFFWSLWHKIPVSERDQQQILSFIFRRLPFLVSWSASYRIWKIESARHAAHLARLAEFRKRGGTGLETAGLHFEDLTALPRPRRLLARAIAFYLPQFHPIPENSKWWGEGFTEWTNVRRARPQFQGHRQPRRPGELGYYDLMEDADVRRRQATLAHTYGLDGFCFYFYWFGGKRLLEGPIAAWAEDQEITFPFCLCWANESWSRRWDGRDDEVLIAQEHTPEDDIAFIQYISRYLRSDQYIRINGKPLLVIYRPDLFPDPVASAARMRDWCRKNGIGEIHLAYTLSFSDNPPEAYGFDSAIEFPPNNMGLETDQGLVCPTATDFDARIYDLTKLAENSSDYPAPNGSRFRGVTPQWDNTARRMNHAAIMRDGGPALYGTWLRNAALDMAKHARNRDERIVFINAWNEWAEGAYLEPDQDHGYAWLAATRSALTPDADPSVEPGDLVPFDPMPEPTAPQKIVLVVHDLFPNGAQIHSLYMAAALRETFRCEITTIACKDGPLAPNFECYGSLIHLHRKLTSAIDARSVVGRLKEQGYTHAILNSSAGGWLTPFLTEAGITCVGLVHEMPDSIRRMKLEPGIAAFDELARKVVFASPVIRDRTAQDVLGHDWNNSAVLSQGLYKAESISDPGEKLLAAEQVRQLFGLPDDAIFVIGVGYGDHRKGIDQFCEWGLEAARNDPRLHFLWIGGIDEDMKAKCDSRLSNAGPVADHVHFPGYQSDTSLFYRAASAYALSSREDPYPSTVLEALACGTPAFLVAGATGFEGADQNPALHVLEDAKAETFTSALGALLANPEAWAASSLSGVEWIQRDFGFRSFVGDLLRLAGVPQPRISVVVPNFNYARFLPHRISTILNQELPVWEIIFLDDASTDTSVEIATTLLKDCGIHYRIVRCEENSGSVFDQWQKGVELARGNIVWIAEADDWSSARFTKVAAAAFADPDVVVSYTQSNQVNQNSEILCPHYLDYVTDIDRDRWRRAFVNEGRLELNDGLSVKNTLPNVSGVLFRREALAATLAQHMDEIRSYRVAGDWCAYVHLAAQGKFAFDPRPLNYHRRHAQSVTISRFTEAEWDEIARMQARVQELAEVSPENAGKAATYLAHLRQRL